MNTPSPSISSNLDPILRATALGKRYGRRDVLSDVSFSVGPGEVVALLGANGAGKTTTLKCILGIIGFTGSVTVAGLDARRDGKRARRNIGYVPQVPALPDDDTSEDALAFLADLKGAPRARVPEMLEATHLTAERRTRVAHLSGGMRQRLALAAALLADPPLLLLDEPAASLDVTSRRDLHAILRDLRAAGKSILISTHLLGHLDEVAARALILAHGRLAFDGSLEQLAQRAHTNRYVVNLNGDRPAEFFGALRAAGIPDHRVQRDEIRWDDVLAAVIDDAPQQEEVKS